MGASQADGGLSLAETEIVQLRHWPVFSGFTTRAKNGFFADADLHSRTHQTVYTRYIPKCPP